MIEVLMVKSYGLSSADTFDVLVSCERTLWEEILPAQEAFFLDLVLIVDPIQESWYIESSIYNLRNPYVLSNKYHVMNFQTMQVVIT
jgi:hypothetical protein